MTSPSPFVDFVRGETLPSILQAFESVKLDLLSPQSNKIKPLDFFDALAKNTPSSLFAAHKVMSGPLKTMVNSPVYTPYREACKRYSVLVVGAGIAGLRSAIECALVGCQAVTVVEKRESYTRNNVLHLWQAVVADFRELGFKDFFGKFAVGGLDHLPIWRIQIILTKIALLLGVEIRIGTSYQKSSFDPLTGDYVATLSTVSSDAQGLQEIRGFNVLVGAEGEKSLVATEFDFIKKELSFGQAIGITANFALQGTQQERNLNEGGFISYMNRDFFNLLAQQSIQLENLVYYSSDTNYFVVTAKKDCLLGNGVLVEDKSSSEELTAPANVSRVKLELFMQKIAELYGLSGCKFATINSVNDVALFDFSKKHTTVTPSKVISQGGQHPLVVGVVGDAAINPFWPQGTGAAHAVMSAMDLAWTLCQLAPLLPSPMDPVDQGQLDAAVAGPLAEHDKLHNFLQTANPDNIKKVDGSPRTSQTIDPKTRY
ncbi:[F-actin]-monooxygenase mical1 [Gonapodya sp. JEL0774]|nr:[F-actin]-monooxygenase mical1 [Gonapodya sp. JEL0774]